MTTLLSVPFAIALTALLFLVLLLVAMSSVLLALLSLLTLDLVLERNGVDRRAHVLRLWRRLRHPAPAASRTAQGAEEPRSATAPRIPFSARRPARPAEPAAGQVAAEGAADEAPELQPAPAQPAVIALTESPTPAADAVTEVLTVSTPPEPRVRAPRVARSPRPTPRRTPAPEPAPAPETEPVDRDSALERLFAPLLESDRTEPLPRTTRAPRRPRDDD